MIKDEAILVNKLKYGETSAVITVYSRNYGVLKGLFKGAYTSKNRSCLEIGNILSVFKKNIFSDKLGLIRAEYKESYLSQILPYNIKLCLLSSMCDMIYKFLPSLEKDEHFYELTKNTIMSYCDQSNIVKHYINWETHLLYKIGYGLDISQCTVSATKDNLFYLSPKTGKAVTKQIGDKYKDKLFIIPKYWLNKAVTDPDKEDLLNSLQILEYFFLKVAKEYNMHLPKSRSILITMV